MNLAEIRAELEADRAWREQEIREFQNRASGISDEDERNRYRRALILLLYAHYEGFSKFVFSLYASAINREGITCGRANYAIAAASLADAFRDLSNPQKKSALFRRDLPDDSKLHRFAREREFMERVSEVESRAVRIPDHVVDTESNLTPVVLRKNLYRLGLPHDQFDRHEPEISKLLGIRNAVSHGYSCSREETRVARIGFQYGDDATPFNRKTPAAYCAKSSDSRRLIPQLFWYFKPYRCYTPTGGNTDSKCRPTIRRKPCSRSQ